jgi:hypothetical protein
MAQPSDVTTPQFRAMLIRKLKNIAPTCTVEFVDGLDSGIGFRLRDQQGRYRTNIIRIFRYSQDVLQRS